MTHTDHSNSDGNPPSLLPYDQWIEAAYREVMLNALEFVIKDGLPGEHSFYLTFKTDYPQVSIPNRLKAKYPEEMTIVLQHQFWDLNVDRDKKQISVGLSFGGVGTILVIPFGSVLAFADPSVNLAFSFQLIPPPLSIVEPIPPALHTIPTPKNEENETAKQSDTSHKNDVKEDSQVISLDAFRKKTD